jgi:hypothetical protein
MSEVREPIVQGMRAVVRQPWATAGDLRNEFAANDLDWMGKTGTLQERDWTGSLFLFAGLAKQQGSAGVCPTAGVITIEFERGGDPDGRATAFFRSALAPLLREELGWGSEPCRL